MHARISNPTAALQKAMPAFQALGKVAQDDTIPKTTLDLVYLRVSQINSCSVCVDMHARDLKEAGESDERLWSVAAWRESPAFTPAERAALALAEAGTRIEDRPDAVSDEVWDEACLHYDEAELVSLTLNIAVINFFNRLNVITRNVPVARAAA